MKVRRGEVRPTYDWNKQRRHVKSNQRRELNRFAQDKRKFLVFFTAPKKGDSSRDLGIGRVFKPFLIGTIKIKIYVYLILNYQ